MSSAGVAGVAGVAAADAAAADASEAVATVDDILFDDRAPRALIRKSISSLNFLYYRGDWMREKVSKYFARGLIGGTRKRARRATAGAVAAAAAPTSAAAAASASGEKRKKRKTGKVASPSRIVPRTRPTTKGLQLIAPTDVSRTHTLVLGG